MHISIFYFLFHLVAPNFFNLILRLIFNFFVQFLIESKLNYYVI